MSINASTFTKSKSQALALEPDDTSSNHLDTRMIESSCLKPTCTTSWLYMCVCVCVSVCVCACVIVCGW